MFAAVHLPTAVQKRDGRIVPFDPTKITSAIARAGQATNEFDFEVAQQLTEKVLARIESMIYTNYPHVEEIQDIVEDVLLSSPYKKTAKAYIIYRDQHMKMREIARQRGIDIVDSYLSKVDWKVNENANMSFSLQGLNNYIASEVSKIYWLYKIYPPEVRDAHVSGDFHIHDLNLIAPYCVGWDLSDLLVRGFGGVSGKLECAPPNHFRSALGQIVNFMFTLQGEAAGAQALSNIDTLLAPFIAHDNLTYEEVKRDVRSFVFNMNVPTRVGFQTPFTNISLDLVPPSHLRDQAVIIGGKPQSRTYGEFQREMNLFNRALFEVLVEGDAKGRVFTFPIPTINITKDFDWDSDIAKLVFEAAAKYGIPYFANYMNSDLKPEDARSMCCRLRLDTKELKYRGGGLFGASPLTGSIGVVTLNLPRLGYLSTSEVDFFVRLEKLLVYAKTSLEIKRKVLERFTDIGLYPYTKVYLRSVKERTGSYWSNHFSTIGILGMNEALLNASFLKRVNGSVKTCGIWMQQGRDFALKVLDYIRERLVKFQEETGNFYNLEATPAEGTSYRLAKLDKERYPDIVTQGNSVPYYTNSTWLPVGFTESIQYILDHQDEFQCKYTGGTVVHLFLDSSPNVAQVGAFLRSVFSKYKLPYLSLTPTFSICPECGYLKGKQEFCEKCGSPTEVYSRIVGYLRPVSNWNLGKKEEFKERLLVTL